MQVYSHTNMFYLILLLFEEKFIGNRRDKEIKHQFELMP